jgi:hypothetical protein
MAHPVPTSTILDALCFSLFIFLVFTDRLHAKHREVICAALRGCGYNKAPRLGKTPHLLLTTIIKTYEGEGVKRFMKLHCA